MAAVKDTLTTLPGVAEVKVDFPNKLAHVVAQKGQFDVKDAIAKLDEKDFKGSTVKEQ